MKQILAENAKELEKDGDPKSKEIAAILNAAVQYDGSKEEAVITELSREQGKKWNLITSILQEERNENTKVKSEVQDVMRGKKSLFEISPLKRFTIGAIQATSETDPTAFMKKELNTQNKKVLAAFLSDTPSVDPLTEDIKKIGTELQSTIANGLQDFNEQNSYNASLPAQADPMIAADEASAATSGQE